jgi:hypothetical protein
MTQARSCTRIVPIYVVRIEPKALHFVGTEVALAFLGKGDV